MTLWCFYSPAQGADFYAPPQRDRYGSQHCPPHGSTYQARTNSGWGTFYNAPDTARLCGVLSSGRWINFAVDTTSCASPRSTVYATRRSHLGCQSRVADGFFQTDNAVVNDFPRLVPTGTGDNLRWGLAAGSAGNDAGCDTFAAQQDRLAAQVAARTGYALNSDGELERFAPTAAAFTTGRTAADISYVRWTAKAASEYTVATHRGATSDRNYLRRADREDASHNIVLAIHPSTETWTVPENTAASGNFGAAWHGSGTLVYDSTLRRSVLSDTRVADYPYTTRHLTKTKSESLCRPEFHPRGEDSTDRIGRSTGRTLSTLRQADAQIADRYWCRSDLRYHRRFKVEHHTGVTEAQRHPQARGMTAGTAFSAYGRLGCYYTTTGQTQITGTSAYECGYMFPLPQCDPDPDNGDSTDWRDYTAAEIAAAGRVGQPFNRAAGAQCAAPPADPPTLADFTAAACVTADLEIYENRPAGQDAEPGVPVSDRTLTTGTSLPPAWDLDVTSAHPRTASPPRDTTAGTGDPDGCADGSESRADHASSPGDAKRSQSPAPTYASSSRTDTAAPPNDADGDIDYSGAAANMAHRYASRIAENTCAAKRAEAGLRLALLESEAELYRDWMGRYEVWARGRQGADAFGGWRPTGYPTGTDPDVSAGSHTTFNSFKHAVRSRSRLTYASRMSAMYAARETAADAVVSTVLTKPVVGGSWCGNPSSFVQSYQTAVGSLKTAAVAASEAGVTPVSPTAGPTSTVTPNQGSAGVVVGSELTAGSAAVPPVYGTAYNWSRTDAEGETTSGSGCYGSTPSLDGVSFTPAGRCTINAGVAEVKASGTASSVTYPSYSFTLSGGDWSRTITVPEATGTAVCSSWRTISCYARPSSHPNHRSQVSQANGTLPAVTNFPSTVAPSRSAGSPALSSLLGEYHPRHTARTDLEHTTAANRDKAATDLGTLTIANAGTTTPAAFASLAVPAPNPATDSTETAQRNAVTAAATAYQNAYTQAYDNAYTQATGHMSAWEYFDWRYETSTLAWDEYEEDPAATFSASTSTPRDGTGCDLVAVASDGTVTVEATRLDFEASSYGNATVYGTRTDAQRTCKIKRTRTPELRLIYAPPAPAATCPATPTAPCGTDTSKVWDRHLDGDTTQTHQEFFYVDYRPTTTAEKFTLYKEAEVFAVLVGLADTAPAFCWAPGTMKISHAAEGRDTGPPPVAGAFLMVSGVPSPRQVRGNTLTQTITVKTGGTDVPTAVYHDVCDSAAQPAVSVLGSGWKAYDDTALSRLATVAASNVPCAGGTATVQQYLPTGHGLAYFNDGSWRYRNGEGDTPTGWRVGRDGLTLQSAPFSYMNATDGSGNRTCVPVALRLIDCSVSAEDVAFLQDIEQLANVSAREEPGDKLDIAAASWADGDPANLMGTALTDVRGWYYPPYREYKSLFPEAEHARNPGDNSHTHARDNTRHSHRAFPENSDGDPSYDRDRYGRVVHPVLAQPRGIIYTTRWNTPHPIAAFKVVPAWIADPAGNSDQAAVCGPVGQPDGLADPDDNLAGARKLGTAADTGNMFAFPITVRTKSAPAWEATGYPLLSLPEECEWSRTTTGTWLPVFCKTATPTRGGDEDPSEAETFADLDIFTETGETAPPANKASLGDADLVLANFAVIETIGEMDDYGYRPDRIQKLRTSFANLGDQPCQNTGWTCLAVRPAGWGALMHRWLQTRTVHVSFAVTLNDWAGAGVSSAETHIPAQEREAAVVPLWSQIVVG